MSLFTVCGPNKSIASDVTADVTAGLIYATKPKDFHSLVNDSKCEKKLTISQAPLNRLKKNNIYLSVATMRKMIQRLLTEKEMSEEKLAKILAIKVGDIGRIFSQEDLSRLISQINLPLIKLYCKTKWI